MFKLKKKGSTLAEILIVAMIVSILCAIAYPVYTKSVTKSRVAQAVNLVELVYNKQAVSYARTGVYHGNFNRMGKLTTGEENIEQAGAKMRVTDYVLTLNEEDQCVSATYDKGGKSFTVSRSYNNPGLGCSGDEGVCKSFGDFVGAAEDICYVAGSPGGEIPPPPPPPTGCDCSGGASVSCVTNGTPGMQTCDGCHWSACMGLGGGGGSDCSLLTPPPSTRPCKQGCGLETASLQCEGGQWVLGAWDAGACMPLAGITQETKACAQLDGTYVSGTASRECSTNCEGTQCGNWDISRCKTAIPCDPAQRPAAACPCYSTGVVIEDPGLEARSYWPAGGSEIYNFTFTATSPGGGLMPAYAACPAAATPGFEGCGLRNREVICDERTGQWLAGDFENACASSLPRQTQPCGKCGTRSRGYDCHNNWWVQAPWGECRNEGVCEAGSPNCTTTCQCETGTAWNGAACAPADCDAASKPAESEPCGEGTCGTKTRPVTCNKSVSPPVWETGAWISGGCVPATQTLPTAQSCAEPSGGVQTRNCTASCDGGVCEQWSSCACPAGKQNVNGVCKTPCTGCGFGYAETQNYFEEDGACCRPLAARTIGTSKVYAEANGQYRYCAPGNLTNTPFFVKFPQYCSVCPANPESGSCMSMATGGAGQSVAECSSAVAPCPSSGNPCANAHANGKCAVFYDGSGSPGSYTLYKCRSNGQTGSRTFSKEIGATNYIVCE